MRPLANEDLMDGERVIAHYERSWFSESFAIGLSAFLAIGAVAIAIIWNAYALLMLVPASLFILAAVIEHKSVSYFLTDKRVIVRQGIFSKHINGIPYCKIQNLHLRKSAIQNLLDIGTIWVDVAGRPDVEMHLTYLKDPEAAQRLILENMDKDREGSP
ncbi:MAG: hypothetical protein MSIBF_03005 [Candidatus Altiarchaeales archaeon IMC4]|nr:MAG: hypothetical protein MSIBF_03005 [Candidatus Altiarchaeales archaeon IMC4]